MYSQTSPSRFTSHGRMMQISPGRHPVSSWNRTMSRTCRLRCGRSALTSDSSIGPDRLRLACFCSPASQASYGFEAMEHERWNQFVLNAPREHSSDTANIAVHDQARLTTAYEF